MISTLHLTRNGLLEPLGQSKVMAYLRSLSPHYNITLITCEKDEDWVDTARVREKCEALGMNWLPQRFTQRPRLIAAALSMVRMAWLVRRKVLQQQAKLVHARSCFPAAVALLVNSMTGFPLSSTCGLCGQSTYNSGQVAVRFFSPLRNDQC